MDENAATLASYDAGVAAYLEHTPSGPSALAHWLADLNGVMFAPGARVLEVGSAGGQDAALLRDAGFDVLATDASAGFVDYLRHHGFPDAVRYDLRHDDPPITDVDVVFANAVLPHLRRRDVKPALQRLHDRLGDDTVLFASVKIGEGEGWSTEKLGTLRWYTYWQPETFTRALQEAGWVVEEARVRAGRYDDWIAVIALPARSALRDAFDERAAHYRLSGWHKEYAEQLVEVTPLERGAHVLDVAAGTGFVARAAARRIGPQGRVTAVDISEGMLAALVEDCAAVPDAAELAPIVPVLADASALPMADASVDAVICGAGLIYMRTEQALREWHRVLRPGGTVAFSTMMAGHPPTSRLFRDHARSYGLSLPDPSLALGSLEACEAALIAAGFTGVAVSRGAVPLTAPDLDRAWDVHHRMARGDLATLPGEDLGRLRAAYVAEVELRIRTDPAFTTALTLYAVGRKPSP